jgi:hypothetical protein
MRVIAFHEKAGRSQVGSSLALLSKVYLSRRVGQCRHAAIRAL